MAKKGWESNEKWSIINNISLQVILTGAAQSRQEVDEMITH